MINLWPDEIEVGKVKSPVTILREQAGLLGEKTKNIVKAEVSTGETMGQEFTYRFYLVAPALQSYHYQLFRISHKITLYPVSFVVDSDIAREFQIGEDNTLIAQSEKRFVEILGRILQSKKTIAVIQALLSQSTDYEPDSSGETPF